MLKQKLIVWIVGSMLLCSSHLAAQKHFLKDESYRTQVHQQFLKRKATAVGREVALFSVLDQNITTEEREALEFLFAYMPLSDLADYDGDFFLKQVRMALKAREYFDWENKIPDDIFRHFVLVYRINNEDMDNAREEFFDELKDRVKGMTMEQAALEVNHWCHEKVTYRATDGRTSAPLALIRTSWGRCGEESTFTTTALRAVGIPARQCYTPRWAHTDDNHAWVEVWIDGKWQFLGACEPEPELNVAWFTAPAKRAMMVHTNVFGAYTGSEEKNLQTDLYSIINLLPNYADTRNAQVKVVDKKGNPVEGATVKFNVYNYAQFYPITTSTTTSDGKASVMTGNGELLVWASDGSNYGYVKSSPGDKEITIVLNKVQGKAYTETVVLTPPVQQPIKEISSEKIAANAARLAYEDSIRNGYMKTFITEGEAHTFAKQNGLDIDKTWLYLSKAQGNWPAVRSLMVYKKDSPYLFAYLDALSEKDLRDTPVDILVSHLDLAEKSKIETGLSNDLIAKYIISPRIAVELVRPWRQYLMGQMKKQGISTAEQIAQYIKSEIKLDEESNYFKCLLSPQGAVDLKIADGRSRNVLFVALCRAEGIAARIEPATSRPQYYSNGNWINVNLNNDTEVQFPKGKIMFKNSASNIVKPAYSTHYTLAKYVDGDFETLNFRGEKALKDFTDPVTVDAGYYRLMIGSRANDGSVTISTQYFTLKKDETKSIELILPKTEGKLQVQGIVDPNTIVTLTDGVNKTLKELSNGKGLIICLSDPDKEPTKHVLQDIPAQKADIDQWGGGVLFMVPDDKVSAAFDASAFKNLPQQSKWGIDTGRALLNAVAGALQIEFTNNFPLIIYLSDNGGILYSTQGYQIGIPENILKTIKAEAATKIP